MQQKHRLNFQKWNFRTAINNIFKQISRVARKKWRKQFSNHFKLLLLKAHSDVFFVHHHKENGSFPRRKIWKKVLPKIFDDLAKLASGWVTSSSKWIKIGVTSIFCYIFLPPSSDHQTNAFIRSSTCLPQGSEGQIAGSWRDCRWALGWNGNNCTKILLNISKMILTL